VAGRERFTRWYLKQIRRVAGARASWLPGVTPTTIRADQLRTCARAVTNHTRFASQRATTKAANQPQGSPKNRY
jgi:hypothetical protein